MKSKLIFGKMTRISDLWDDDASCNVTVDGRDFATIDRNMVDVGLTSREIRVSGYDVSFADEELTQYDYWFDAKPSLIRDSNAKAAYKLAKDHVREVYKLHGAAVAVAVATAKQVIVTITVDHDRNRDPEDVANEAVKVLEKHFGSAWIVDFKSIEKETP